MEILINKKRVPYVRASDLMNKNFYSLHFSDIALMQVCII